MVKIPPGTFLMGSPASEVDREEDEKQHQVTISEGFWMGRYEVTQAEYVQVMGTNPSHFKGTNLPVDSVSWYNAVKYCTQLTARERKAGRLPAGHEFRLPTEAQWEYACRAGTKTATPFGGSLNSSQANFCGDYPYPDGGQKGPYLKETKAVRQYRTNAFGLYDMQGNVWEWCSDYLDPYPGGAMIDPMGPRWGDFRVIRGGGWESAGQLCRSASRSGGFPSIGTDSMGFRVVLVRVQSGTSGK